VVNGLVARTYGGYGLIVNVRSRVFDNWFNFRQLQKEDTEACGIMVGSIDSDLSRIWIEHITTPKLKDKRNRYGFELLDPYHQKFIDKKYKKSNGELIYLGTWHTHPESVPTPSVIDKKDWNLCVDRNKTFPKLIFGIVGTDQINLFLKHGNKFVKMKGQE